MKSISNELVVLFSSETYGVCIVPTSTMNAGTISQVIKEAATTNQSGEARNNNLK